MSLFSWYAIKLTQVSTESIGPSTT